MFKKTINFSGDGGEGGGGAPEFTPDQEKVISERIAEAVNKNKPTLQTATDLISKAGGRVFLSDKAFQDEVLKTFNSTEDYIDNPNDLQKTIMGYKKGLAGQVLSPIDKEVKELTGLEKEEGEKTRDYIKRVLDLQKKNGDPETEAALKAKLKSANDSYQKLEGEFKALKEGVIKSERDNLIAKGFPSNLDYSEAELKALMPGVKAQLFENFEFEKDEKGWKVVNKQTGEPELTSEGTRKTPADITNEFVQGLNLRVKADEQGEQRGAPGPNGAPVGSNGKPLSADQINQATEAWKKDLQDKGLYGHEKEAFELRKQHNLPLPEAAVQKWPELK